MPKANNVLIEIGDTVTLWWLKGEYKVLSVEGSSYFIAEIGKKTPILTAYYYDLTLVQKGERQ